MRSGGLVGRAPAHFRLEVAPSFVKIPLDVATNPQPDPLPIRYWIWVAALLGSRTIPVTPAVGLAVETEARDGPTGGTLRSRQFDSKVACFQSPWIWSPTTIKTNSNALPLPGT
jgi:hypothetical protein